MGQFLGASIGFTTILIDHGNVVDTEYFAFSKAFTKDSHNKVENDCHLYK